MMNLIETAEKLIAEAEALLNDEAAKEKAALPDGGYFLSGDAVLCCERENGDARYPYAADGFNMWAYSSGYISINESTFYVVLPSDEGKEPYLNFYAGLPAGGEGGGFVPVSLLGIARSPLEGAVKRYTVFTPQAVYYLTCTPQADFVVRAYVTRGKTVRFSVGALAKEETALYLSSYFNCFFMHAAGECCETKWFKQCKLTENGFGFYSAEDPDRKTHLDNYGVLNRSVLVRPTGAGERPSEITEILSTTSRTDFTGAKNNYLAASYPLRTGRFSLCKKATRFTDTAVAGDVIHMRLEKGASARANYSLDAVFSETERDRLSVLSPDAEEFDAYLLSEIKADEEKKKSPLMLEMRFGGSRLEKLRAETLEKFLSFVVRQVEFAALSKNSGVSLLGVRDVFQQLEAALMWTGQKCRDKIVEALGFIGRDGRPPRQYSIPPSPDVPPRMDLRKFVDQGVWIIDAVYRYLAYTGDYSVLKEECGYYDFENGVVRTEERTNVLEHIVRISRFLISNVDEETGCLHALYGDWNDALDGMGGTEDPEREFGTGVSVMATLQLYANMTEMAEILEAVGESGLLPAEAVKRRLYEGLKKYALVPDKEGRRILHGWGDKRSYLVGSACDPDGKDRVGLTANAFWAISGLYDLDTSVKEDILRAYERLDSGYGYRTFDKYFAPFAPGVGRIGHLPRGTAENSATYVHATLFGVWSLLIMGEGERAWEQLVKALPFTHEHLSTTQFVMSNSYSFNEEFEMDGESMSDWYTGSANVLIKLLVRWFFGVDATLRELYIRPAAYFPFDSASIRVNVCGCSVSLTYSGGKGEKGGKTASGRSFVVDGKPVVPLYDEVRGIPYLKLPKERLTAERLVIEVKD